MQNMLVMLAALAYQASGEQRQHVNTVAISKLPCCPCMCFALCHLLLPEAAVCSCKASVACICVCLCDHRGMKTLGQGLVSHREHVMEIGC